MRKIDCSRNKSGEEMPPNESLFWYMNRYLDSEFKKIFSDLFFLKRKAKREKPHVKDNKKATSTIDNAPLKKWKIYVEICISAAI